eukprot:4430144-Prymnesium_polylepis.2
MLFHFSPRRYKCRKPIKANLRATSRLLAGVFAAHAAGAARDTLDVVASRARFHRHPIAV